LEQGPKRGKKEGTKSRKCRMWSMCGLVLGKRPVDISFLSERGNKVKEG
jgi:hypothetical protein